MKRYIGISLMLLGLWGCTAAPVKELPENVTLSEPQSRMGSTVRLVDAVTFERQGAVKQSPATCVSLNVDNSEVTLSDSSASFVGAYTGTYYDIESSRKEGGGATLQHADEESGVVVAKGVTEYTSGGLMPIGHAARYKLLVAPMPGKTVVQFKDIEYAQKSTGYMENTGFQRLGTWWGSGVMDAYAAMEQQADKVLDCIYSESLVGE